MVQKKVEISLERLLIAFSLMFVLGIIFAISNGTYAEQTGDSLPFVVYGISFLSLVLGAVLILIFEKKINNSQFSSVLKVLEVSDAEVIKVLLENNNKLEQNHLVAFTGYNKVKISRILTKFEQKGLIEKRQLGNTNLVILKL